MPGSSTPLQGARLFCYLLLPLTLVVGLDMVAHGHVTPGGGFRGGMVLATGIHLLYVAGRYRSLEKLRPTPVFDVLEAAGTAAYAALGVATLAATGTFLASALPAGTFRPAPFRSSTSRSGSPLPAAGSRCWRTSSTRCSWSGATRRTRSAHLRLPGRWSAAAARRVGHCPQQGPRAGRRVPVRRAVGHLRAPHGDRIPERRLGTGVRVDDAPDHAGRGSGGPGHDPHRRRRLGHGDHLLLALAIQIHKDHGTVDPDELSSLEG